MRVFPLILNPSPTGGEGLTQPSVSVAAGNAPSVAGSKPGGYSSKIQRTPRMASLHGLQSQQTKTTSDCLESTRGGSRTIVGTTARFSVRFVLCLWIAKKNETLPPLDVREMPFSLPAEHLKTSTQSSNRVGAGAPFSAFCEGAHAYDLLL